MKHLLTTLTLAGVLAFPGVSVAQPMQGDTKPLINEPRVITKTMSWIEDFIRLGRLNKRTAAVPFVP